MRAMRVAAIPAYQAASTVGDVVRGAREGFDEVWVLDDGSTDGTGAAAAAAGAVVVRHEVNRGKGEGLRTLLERARERGLDALVTLDADGQHPAAEAIRLDREVAQREALVLGVRDLHGANAPPTNRRGNRIANYWVNGFTHRALLDTQCGLRRYPVAATLALGVSAARFAFETEVVLRAALRGVPIVELPIEVRYPPERTSHFRLVRDPGRIVATVVRTVIEERGLGWFLRAAGPLIRDWDLGREPPR